MQFYNHNLFCADAHSLHIGRIQLISDTSINIPLGLQVFINYFLYI